MVRVQFRTSTYLIRQVQVWPNVGKEGWALVAALKTAFDAAWVRKAKDKLTLSFVSRFW